MVIVRIRIASTILELPVYHSKPTARKLELVKVGYPVTKVTRPIDLAALAALVASFVIVLA